MNGTEGSPVALRALPIDEVFGSKFPEFSFFSEFFFLLFPDGYFSLRTPEIEMRSALDISFPGKVLGIVSSCWDFFVFLLKQKWATIRPKATLSSNGSAETGAKRERSIVVAVK